MAREVQVRVWCDPCMEEDVRNEGVYTSPVSFGTKKAREVALCPTHHKELYQPFEDLLTRLGQIVDGSPAQGTLPLGVEVKHTKNGSALSGPELCLAPGCASVATTLKSMRNHVRSAHGLSARQYDTRYAIPGTPEHTRLSDEKRAGSPTTLISDEFKCPLPDCDVTYDPSQYTRPKQAIGQHKRTAHPDIKDWSPYSAVA